MKFFLTCCFFLISNCGLCQPSYDNWTIRPDKPLAGDSIEIFYRPVSSLVQSRIKAVVYYNQIGCEEPRAIEVPFKKREKEWTATIPTSGDDVSLMINFYDSLGVLDNNEEMGYWSPLYNSQKESIPGSLATIAYMYCGAWSSSSFGISASKELARRLYEADFKRNSQLKRIYYRFYISSIRYDKEAILYRRELDAYASLGDLTEWELLDLGRKFEAIGDSALAKKFNNLVLQSYPSGCWAAQVTSLEYQKRFLRAESPKQQIAIYKEFKNRFAAWKGECAEWYLENIECITFLSRLILACNKLNELESWRSAVDSLPPSAKYFTYFLASKTLNEERKFLDISELLSKESAVWMQDHLNAPRLISDRLWITDSEVRKNREDLLAECLSTHAISLILQNKNDQAFQFFQKAIEHSHKKKDEINRLFKEYFLKENTFVNNNQQRKFVSKVPNLIKYEPASITFLDQNQKKVSLSDYKGKIIVLDFWASWCAPCLVGFDGLNKIKSNLRKNREVVFLLVNTQERGDYETNLKKAETIMKRRRLDFILLFDIVNQANSIFDFSSLPTTVIIDKSGLVRYQYSGSDKSNELLEVIQALRADTSDN